MSESSGDNFGSPKRLRSPRKRLAAAAQIKATAWLAHEKNTSKGRKKTGEESRRKSAEPSENDKKLAALFLRALATAYNKTGLDQENPRHEFLLLLWLSWAVYGAKSAGQPVKWSPEFHESLLADVASLRERRPDLTSELKLCNALVSGRDALERYKRFKNGSSLRRRLQAAKKPQISTPRKRNKKA
jgi:hypothetical protein